MSFRDGLKFNGCKANTRLLRDTSDRICLEHGLSVIKEPKGRRVGTYLYKMEHAGMPTRYNVARQAIDESVALSLTIEEFKSELRKRGYSYRFDPQRKYWTITPPGWKKAIRIHQLGDNYTRESIERRIYENEPSVRQERLRQNYRLPNQYNLRRRIDRIMGKSGLEKLYLRYCYELGYLPRYRQNPTKLHILLKEDLLKCDQYSEQAKLLSKYHVNTDEDLSHLVEKLEDVRLTTDGQAEPYIHGEPWDAGYSIELVHDPDLLHDAADYTQEIELPDSDYVLLSEEDVEKMIAEEAKNGGSK